MNRPRERHPLVFLIVFGAVFAALQILKAEWFKLTVLAVVLSVFLLGCLAWGILTLENLAQ